MPTSQPDDHAAAVRRLKRAITDLQHALCLLDGHEWNIIYHGRQCSRCNRSESWD